jgi:nucleoside-diphosphate-sugar epimerase
MFVLEIRNEKQIMKDKIVLVTGGNSGIGLVTVTELAKLGATTILVARDRSKGQAALEQAKRDSGSNDIHLMLADLSSQVDVRNLALEVQNRFPRLDVLVNNAALVPAVRQVTSEGMEVQLAVNHLAPFLLTNLLLEHLKKSDQGRIVTVSSVAHTNGKANFADIQRLADVLRHQTLQHPLLERTGPKARGNPRDLERFASRRDWLEPVAHDAWTNAILGEPVHDQSRTRRTDFDLPLEFARSQERQR